MILYSSISCYRSNVLLCSHTILLIVYIEPVLSTCPLHSISSGCGKERRILFVVHGDLPRQHSFGTTLRFTGPVPADSRQ